MEMNIMNKTHYEHFKSLHDQKSPLILYNCWDVASAIAIEKAGTKAIATSSFSMAEAWGYSDGEQLSFENVLWFISKIAEHVTVPLTVDIEGGFAEDDDTLEKNMEQLLQLDICGINFEDQKVNNEHNELWDIVEQSNRIKKIRQVAAKLQRQVFINARTDLFFKETKHSIELVDKAIERTYAYADAGAECIFIPGLSDRKMIEYFVRKSPLPVNVMVMESMISNYELQEMGVKRISYGPLSFFQSNKDLQARLENILEG